MSEVQKNDQRTKDLNIYKLRLRQSYPLDMKIEFTIKRIELWLDWCDENGYGAYVAYSKGKDSTVLAHIVQKLMNVKIPLVFSNTGLEYPEIVQHDSGFDNVLEVRPKYSFKQIIDKYGYPVISKRVAQYIYEVQHAKDKNSKTVKLRMTGWNSKGRYSPMAKIPDKWQYLCNAPFSCSDKCCFWLKKRPMLDYMKKSGNLPIVATMTSESNQRELTYKLYGCNAYEQAKQPRSTPMAWWNDSDIWEYIKKYNVPYSPIYDMGYSRTGCMFCMFGIHLESKINKNNRFQMMQKTHTKQHHYCMNKLECKKVCDYIGVPTEYDDSPDFEQQFFNLKQ